MHVVRDVPFLLSELGFYFASLRFWLIYLAYCGILLLLQRQIVFPRGMIPQPAASHQKKNGLEEIWLLRPVDGSIDSNVDVYQCPILCHTLSGTLHFGQGSFRQPGGSKKIPRAGSNKGEPQNRRISNIRYSAVRFFAFTLPFAQSPACAGS